MKEKSYTASKECMHTPKPPQFAHVDKSSFPKVINEQSLSSYCRKYKNEISSGIKKRTPQDSHPLRYRQQEIWLCRFRQLLLLG